MYTAISWCVEGGIISKMIRETKVVMNEAGFKGSYWFKPRNLGHQQLYLVHILPAIILCLSGLGAATIIFISEIIYHRCRATYQTTKVKVGGNLAGKPFQPKSTMRHEDPKPMDEDEMSVIKVE